MMKKIKIALSASAIAFALISAFAFKAPKEVLANAYQGTLCPKSVTCSTGAFACTVNNQPAYADPRCMTLAQQPTQ
jgi:hypothetical protein